jgi:type II secretory pathway component PulJ
VNEPEEIFIEGLGDAELKELERIKKQNGAGMLHPEDVIREAKKASSPLHARFEWDDAAASRKWRLAQARALIRCVKVVYPDRKPVRYFPHVRSDRKGYRQHEEVLHVEQLRKSYLHQFARDVESIIDKYQNFAELSGAVKSLGGLLAKIQRNLPVDKKAA